MCFQIFTNSFSLKAESLQLYEPFGTAIYLSGSYFDHSCKPNARSVLSGRRLDIMATTDIYAANNDVDICSNASISKISKISFTFYMSCYYISNNNDRCFLVICHRYPTLRNDSWNKKQSGISNAIVVYAGTMILINRNTV